MNTLFTQASERGGGIGTTPFPCSLRLWRANEYARLCPRNESSDFWENTLSDFRVNLRHILTRPNQIQPDSVQEWAPRARRDWEYIVCQPAITGILVKPVVGLSGCWGGSGSSKTQGYAVMRLNGATRPTHGTSGVLAIHQTLFPFIN